MKLWVMHGSKWSKMRANLPGRTTNQIKNRYNANLKKRFLDKEFAQLVLQHNLSEVKEPPVKTEESPKDQKSKDCEIVIESDIDRDSDSGSGSDSDIGNGSGSDSGNGSDSEIESEGGSQNDRVSEKNSKNGTGNVLDASHSHHSRKNDTLEIISAPNQPAPHEASS